MAVPAGRSEPRPENVATPPDGVAVAVVRVFPPESFTVAVTAVDQEVTVFPAPSRIVSDGCEEKSAPYVASPAEVVIDNEDAVPAVTVTD